ncbi:MAG TPA: metal ABC transporter substrate-binding protein [Acidimicrobiales bacterium]|jgi:zinc transport system substrate-binding protein
MVPTPGWFPAVLACAVLAAGCGAAAGSGKAAPVRVAAGVYPLAFAAQRVGGDRVDVVTLTPPGVEPHDLELDPDQVDDVQTADLVLLVGGGLQPAVEAAAGDADGEVVDVLAAVDVVGGDPHVWLDPVRMQAVVAEVADALAAVDGAGAAGYRARADELAGELAALDADLRAGLADCRSRLLVTTHAAFGYLAGRYDLEPEPLTGLAPEAEADPDRLAELADLVEGGGVTTVFTEALAPADLAETLAAEAGVGTAVLDPIEGPPAEGDYLDAMWSDLAALREGLGCR